VTGTQPGRPARPAAAGLPDGAGLPGGASRRIRLLIIGASGFLGTHVRRQARAAGMSVVTAGRSALPGPGSHQLVDLALAGQDQIAAMLAAAAPDVVVNCAGLTSGRPEELAAVNITGTCALARAMLAARLPARLVHLGSAAEYGGAEPGDPVTESTPARPVSMYGVTKLAGTQLVGLARAAGLSAVVLRIFNPVGPGAPEGSLPGRLAGQLRRSLAGGGRVQLGPLDAVRDFVDARDVASAVLAAAAASALPHAVLNIGSGRGVPVRSLVKELAAIAGCSCPVEEDAAGSPRSSGLDWQQADISCAVADLGWLPRRDLGTSLADMWEASHDLDLR
jgi:nucleoside-diphosphate-sugar epimerase